jgi:N-acetylglutamate synthase-like GNAT family acetyltransferase
MKIIEHTIEYTERVVDFILEIQRGEFGVSITAEDQPDLKNVKEFYQQRNGNFRIALDGEKVIGTIALIDIGNNQTALRKMFVASDYRGKEKGVAQQLMNSEIEWCKEKKIKAVYLGTTDSMKAAHRFYEKNGFVLTDKHLLPETFPVMAVDTVFYTLSFNNPE